MLLKTHLALSVFFILILWGSVTGRIAFTLIILLATLIPDMDSASSLINRKIRPFDIIFNFLFKHRGALHSITFCIIFTIILALFSQKLALPFFLGYSIHLLADSFTITGIRAFWPSNKEIKWIIRTGGLTERITLYLLIVIDLFLIIAMIR